MPALPKSAGEGCASDLLVFAWPARGLFFATLHLPRNITLWGHRDGCVTVGQMLIQLYHYQELIAQDYFLKENIVLNTYVHLQYFRHINMENP